MRSNDVHEIRYINLEIHDLSDWGTGRIQGGPLYMQPYCENVFDLLKKIFSTPTHICRELIAIYYVHEVFYLNYELMAVGP